MTKKALLIGINYFNTSNELRGCINDTYNMKALLLQNGWEESNIVLMNDAQDKNGPLYPSGKNIISAIESTVATLVEGDTFFFHYSGHGSYRVLYGEERLQHKEETDGRNEEICPIDFDENGMIEDDDLRKVLVDAVAPGVKVRAIFDSCHSGTVLDLRYLYSKSFGKRAITELANKWILDTNEYIPESKGDVRMISGCRDEQTSADAYINGKFSGALTYAFINACKEKGTSSTCFTLLETIYDTLRKGRYTQIPLLSTSIETNPSDETFF